MKKLFTSFAIMALLIGAFTLDANAQPGKVVKSKGQKAPETQVTATEVNAATPVTTELGTAKPADKKVACPSDKNTTSCCKDANKAAAVDQKLEAAPQENWEMVIKSYETAVDDCVKLYKQVQSDEKGNKDLIARYDEALNNVEAIGAKIEKALPELPRTLAGRYNQAKQKLSVVYQKG